jgi:O-antigen/teichoic acid export membrane protein
LLQILFPIVNVLLLKPLQGDAAVGWYDAGYKWLNVLVVIPTLFTYAVFPVMSRQAAQDRSELKRSYRLSVKLLTALALPAAILFTLLATPLVGFLSGSAFLPHGAVALRVLIWSAIFGWVNSLTNYVLMALDRQRQVMMASAVRVVFAVVANLLFVGRFGFVASAWIIVAGEFLLVLLFTADLRRHLGPVGWGRLLWRVVLAALLTGGVVWGLSFFSAPLAVLAGVIVYPVALLLLRALTPEERAMLEPLLPAPLQARLGWGTKTSH